MERLLLKHQERIIGITTSNSSTSITVSGSIFVVVSSTTSTNSNIYFDNGTCNCPNASVGDTATISGTLYTVVDNSSIGGQIDNGNPNLCTSKVTNMANLFSETEPLSIKILIFGIQFNVTDMSGMFS